MKHCFKKAYAKINLTLDVLSTREDGYHELCMVMQQVSLCDTIAVRIGCDWEGIRVISNLGYLPCDDRNIAYKAARAFLQHTGANAGGIQIAIEKRIPVAAGLAGGSADGAAVILALNDLLETGLHPDVLCNIGLKVGADVPFCIRGGTMLAEGVGEILTPLAPMPSAFIVLCKPSFGMSTPKVFSAFDAITPARRPDTSSMIQALEQQDLSGISANLCNVLEDVVSAEHPEIQIIRRRLLDAGALGTIMSGSGSTVFGIFTDPSTAQAAADILRVAYPDTHLAKTIN